MHELEPRMARTDDEILACFPVMAELRTHLRAETFLQQVRAQQQQGYELAYLAVNGRPAAVAGFRLGTNLAWGRFLYLDDLVTSAALRSQGHGARLLGWLHELARSRGCAQLHLDSGLVRKEAHRFYEREGMEISSHHFRSLLS